MGMIAEEAESPRLSRSGMMVVVIKGVVGRRFGGRLSEAKAAAE